MPKISVRNLSWKYATGQGWAIDDLSFDVEEGELLVVTGATGSGKTTLCLCLSGLIPHNYNGVWKGSVTVGGRDTRQMTMHEISQKVGIVFQDPDSQFLTMSVTDEIAFGPENLAVPREEIGERIRRAAELVRIGNCLDRAPYELSGGQKQRVAIASALALEPEVLILDEPTSQLDPVGKEEVFAAIQEIRKRNRTTTILVEHSLDEAVEYADRFMLMGEGRMKRLETPQRFFSEVEYLTSNGVPVPQVTQLGHLQSNSGTPMDEYPLTLETAVPVFEKTLEGMEAES